MHFVHFAYQLLREERFEKSLKNIEDVFIQATRAELFNLNAKVWIYLEFDFSWTLCILVWEFNLPEVQCWPDHDTLVISVGDTRGVDNEHLAVITDSLISKHPFHLGSRLPPGLTWERDSCFSWPPHYLLWQGGHDPRLLNNSQQTWTMKIRLCL